MCAASLAAGLLAVDRTAPRAIAQSQDATLQPGTTRLERDREAIQTFRPGHPFWQHVFNIPDGSVAFGSAVDGRLLAVFPAKGDWTRDAVWAEPSLERLLAGRELPRALDERRSLVAQLLEAQVGPIVHNPTRGTFVLPNIRLYGGFVAEWAAIYERFGVPADVGLAQVLVESGFSGTRRSEARAIGFCQWLESNWRHLNRLSPHTIESRNQTTQAAYCAAYLSILATKYGSFIPALSDHHSGGANVGRVLINGERLGAADVREQYFLGGQLARELRAIDLYGYRDIYRTYGPRSYAYAEMVFGNAPTIRNIIATSPQVRIHAMRTTRALRLADITKRTRLSPDEVRRFNPALVRSVPAHATLYLPMYVKDFGADVAFWHRAPTSSYAQLLEEFLRIDATPERWDQPAFMPVLRDFQARFRATRTEEGTVFATVLDYVIGDASTSGRREILAEFRTSPDVQLLFERGLRVRAESALNTLACGEDPVLAGEAARTTC